jgi:hypothetical protein
MTQLTGDVTAGPGSGSQAATIPNNTVTYAKLQDVSAASKLLGRGSASGAGDPEEITLGTNLAMSGTTLNATDTGITQLTGDVTAGSGSGSQAATLSATFKKATIGASLYVVNDIVYVEVPFACTITAWRIVADVSGSAVVDVWKDSYTNFPPVVGDSIAASAKPTLSSAQKNEDTTLTGWTTSVTAGDWIAFKLESMTTCTFVQVQLTATRT